MNSIEEALGIVLAMGVVVLFCRAFPFIFFRGDSNAPEKQGGAAEKNGNISLKESLIAFVEKIVPPAAMTVLAFNALGGAIRDNPLDGLLVCAASIFTALIHIWKRNSMVSIFGGTALYMILLNVVEG